MNRGDNIRSKITNKINVLSTGCSVSTNLRNLLEQCREQDKALTAMKNTVDMLDMTVEEYANEIEIIGGYPEFSYELLKKLSDLYDKSFVLSQENISNLKKRIKYCKTPMERKRLQQELNTSYKKQKRTIKNVKSE